MSGPNALVVVLLPSCLSHHLFSMIRDTQICFTSISTLSQAQNSIQKSKSTVFSSTSSLFVRVYIAHICRVQVAETLRLADSLIYKRLFPFFHSQSPTPSFPRFLKPDKIKNIPVVSSTQRRNQLHFPKVESPVGPDRSRDLDLQVRKCLE